MSAIGGKMWEQLDSDLMPRIYKYTGLTSPMFSYFLIPNDNDGFDLIVERVDAGRSRKIASVDEFGIGATSKVEKHNGGRG